MSKAMDEAKAMLPPRLHPQLEAMCAEYKFACLKHHGFEMVSPKVIAELVLNQWCSRPIFSTSMVAGGGAALAGAAAAVPWATQITTMCTCGLQKGEEEFCKHQQCGLKKKAA